MTLNRFSTGIERLDVLLGGGIPEHFSVLITGYTGTGKTILALQLMHNLAQQGLKGLYLTFEEDTRKLIQQGECFGWDVQKLLDDGLLEIHPVRKYEYDIREIISYIAGKRTEDEIGVVVIDSLLMMTGLKRVLSGGTDSAVLQQLLKRQELFQPGVEEELRKEHIAYIIKEIDAMKLMALYVSEPHHEGMLLTAEGVAEYECDGVILLKKKLDKSKVVHEFVLEKLRCTPVECPPQQFFYGKNGIKFA